MSQTTKVLIVDDHPFVRGIIAELLQLEDDIRVVGEAVDGHNALHLVPELQPDVVVIDYRMPDMNGDEVTRRLLAWDEDLVVIGISNDDENIVRTAMQEAGASTFHTKGGEFSELVEMIRGTAASDERRTV